MDVKEIISKFHFSDFSIKDLKRELSKAQKKGATHYDVVVKSHSTISLSENFIQFFRIRENEEIINDEIKLLEMKIEALKKNI